MGTTRSELPLHLPLDSRWAPLSLQAAPAPEQAGHRHHLHPTCRPPSPLRCFEVPLSLPPVILLGRSASEEINCCRREVACCSGTEASNSWENEHPAPLAACRLLAGFSSKSLWDASE